MPFYIYAWTGAVISGLFVITAKLTSKHSIKNPWLFNFLLAAVTLLFTAPPAIYYHAVLPNGWLLVILTGFFATLNTIFYIFSNANLDVSVFMPLYNFRNIFTLLIGFLFFGERFPAFKLFYIGLIIIAGVFTSLDEKFSLKSFFKITIAIGLLTVLFSAINSALTKAVLINNDLWTTNLWIAIINFVLLIPTIPLFKKDLKKLDAAHITPIALMGLFFTLSFFAANKGYEGNYSVTSLIMVMPFSMIFAFMFSIFAPKLLEKHTLKIYAIRFSSAAVMIWAAMQLTK
ncbi:MAG: DMT family transporter [Patescibacteria group bacterium]|jgi:drug/metabolite transporter (DMT)-like permease